jgi:hypothetical protein
MRLEGLGQLKTKSNNLIGNRNRDLPACNIVPQPNTLPRAPQRYKQLDYVTSNDKTMMTWKGFGRNGYILSRYRHGICLDGLKETTGHISQNSLCRGRDSKRAPSEYKSKTFLYSNLLGCGRIEENPKK